MRPANTETIAGVSLASAAAILPTCSCVITAVTLSLMPARDSVAISGPAKFALGVGHRNLDIDVVAPRGDLARLLFHGGKVVGEHLERNRPIGNGFEHVERERFVVGDAGLRASGSGWW